jgi:hypothetical protein
MAKKDSKEEAEGQTPLIPPVKDPEPEIPVKDPEPTEEEIAAKKKADDDELARLVAEEEAAKVAAVKPSEPLTIESAEEAVQLVKSKYNVPAGVRAVHVCSDKNVFYDRNQAMVHVNQYNREAKDPIKLFTISWA